MPGIVSAKPHSSVGPKLRFAPPKPADNEQGTPVPAVIPGLSKETRAHEHHRQRLKKTTETANLRARKLASATKQLSLSQPRTSTNKVHKGSDSSEDVADVDDVPVYDANRVEEQPELISGRSEISLADFVVTRKTRKGIDNDFEVIPHVRSVIILDDKQPHDIEIDEPWEYINGVDEDHRRSDPVKPSSYAKVVAQAK